MQRWVLDSEGRRTRGQSRDNEAGMACEQLSIHELTVDQRLDVVHFLALFFAATSKQSLMLGFGPEDLCCKRRDLQLGCKLLKREPR